MQSKHARPTVAQTGSLRPTASRGFAALVALLLLLPLAACGGEDAEQEVTIAEDATPQELMSELQQIQQELGTIQQQTLEQNPELQSGRDSVERRLEAQMEQLDPEAQAKMARAEEIGAEFQAAQEGGEEAEAQELATEHQQIQASLQQTRSQALQTEEMTTALDSFQERMLEAMNEVDPRTDSLMARADAIVAHLQEEMARQQAAPEGGAAPQGQAPQGGAPQGGAPQGQPPQGGAPEGG